MAEELRAEVEAALARGLATPSMLVPRDGQPRVDTLGDDEVVVDWRLPDGSVSLLESGLPACEAVLAEAGYDVRLANDGEQLLVRRKMAL
jgi:hypothetical protein